MDQYFNNESDIIDTVSKHKSIILELSLSPDSLEVAFTIAGYIAKTLTKRFKCQQCCMHMIADDNGECHYFNLVSRGGLMVSSSPLPEFVQGAFAILDYTKQFIEKEKCFITRDATEKILKLHAPKSILTCTDYIELGHKFDARIIVNKQKLTSDEVCKDAVVSFKTRQRLKDKTFS